MNMTSCNPMIEDYFSQLDARMSDLPSAERQEFSRELRAHVLDRLERAGLVVRDGSPTDLRTKQVALTLKGKDLVERVLSVHASQIDAVLACLTTKEQVEFHRLLDRLGHHLEGLLSEGAAVG